MEEEQQIKEDVAQLTFEQQFRVTSFNQTADQMSREQAISFLKGLHVQMLLRENLYKHFLKQEWTSDFSRFETGKS